MAKTYSSFCYQLPLRPNFEEISVVLFREFSRIAGGKAAAKTTKWHKVV
jgi:hypothetical protein